MMDTLKQRVLTGWNLPRALYFLLGAAFVVQGVMEQQWLIVLAGGYFAAMGLFAFGCAAGSCYGGNCSIEAPEKSSQTEN